MNDIPHGISLTGILRGLLGIVFIIGLCYFFSENRKKISWKVVFTGLLLQVLLGIGVIYIPAFYKAFEFIGKLFIGILDFSKEGSRFIFGDLVNSEKTGFIFAFQVLPVIIFFGALTGVLYYYGIVQRLVQFFAWMLQRLMNLSGAESLATSANMFLGQSESPLLIKSYLNTMSRSEIFQLMVAGMSMLAGSVLGAYIGFLGGNNPEHQLIFAKHLIAASVMAAPASIVIAKILIPQDGMLDKRLNIIKTPKQNNVLSALSNGTNDGLKLAVNVAAMLIVFIAFIALFNFVALRVGTWTHLNDFIEKATSGKYHVLSLQLILGYAFSPVMWMIGVCPQDIVLCGRLLGEKIVLTEFIGYLSLSDLKTAGAFAEQKTIIMATYCLSGFANFASIGIQIACIGSLAPEKKDQVSDLGIKAMVAGTFASLLSATWIGLFIG
jgi:concentrative nucleoside transporter, CNT family